MLTSAVGRAHREQEPVPEAGPEVRVRHWLASGSFRRGKQVGPGPGPTVALEVAGVVFTQESENFCSLLLGGLFGEDALHLRLGLLHWVEPIDRYAVAGTVLDSHGAGLFELGGDSRAPG